MAWETVSVIADGYAYRTWTESTVEAGAAHATRGFSIIASEPNQMFMDAWPLRPGVDVRVMASGEPMLRGFIDTYAPEFGLDYHRAVISGRSKSKDADEVFPRYGITTIRRQACIVAHAAVETGNSHGAFQRLEEDLNYSAERLQEVWPKRFPTVASAAPFAHNPHALAIKVYGARMGNRRDTDDGWNFRGQGLWNETGRGNVTELAKLLGVSPETALQWLKDPAHALECACARYKLSGVQPYADSGDVTKQTLHVNGGKNGLPERQVAYDKTVKLLTAEVQVARVAAVEPEEPPKKVTARDLRAAGSRTIAGTDRVKTGLTNLATGATAVTATASTVNSVAGQISDAADSVTGAVQSSSAALAWAEGHWKALAIVTGAILVIVAFWQIWRGASQAEAARVDDARSGVNPSR